MIFTFTSSNASAALLSMQWASYGLQAKFFDPTEFESKKSEFAFYFKKQMKRILSGPSKKNKNKKIQCNPLPVLQTDIIKQSNANIGDNFFVKSNENRMPEKFDSNEMELKEESLKLDMIFSNSPELIESTQFMEGHSVHKNERNDLVKNSCEISSNKNFSPANGIETKSLTNIVENVLQDEDAESYEDSEYIELVYRFHKQIEKKCLKDSNPGVGKIAACSIDGAYMKVKILEINCRQQKMTVELLHLKVVKTISVCRVKYFDEKENTKAYKRQLMEANINSDCEENSKETNVENDAENEITDAWQSYSDSWRTSFRESQIDDEDENVCAPKIRKVFHSFIRSIRRLLINNFYF